jgi:hypothetical protein
MSKRHSIPPTAHQWPYGRAIRRLEKHLRSIAGEDASTNLAQRVLERAEATDDALRAAFALMSASLDLAQATLHIAPDAPLDAEMWLGRVTAWQAELFRLGQEWCELGPMSVDISPDATCASGADDGTSGPEAA